MICSGKTGRFIHLQIPNINSLNFSIPPNVSGVVKWLCPNLSLFLSCPSDGSGRRGEPLRGEPAACSLPPLQQRMESAEKVVVILGNGARFEAAQGFVQMSFSFPHDLGSWGRAVQRRQSGARGLSNGIAVKSSGSWWGRSCAASVGKAIKIKSWCGAEKL